MAKAKPGCHPCMARFPQPHRTQAETHRMAVISTAHITRSMADAFDDGDAPSMTGRYGWLLWIPPDEYAEVQPLTGDARVIEDILRWARRHGYGYVMLDADGRIISDLPSFDW